MAKQTIKILMVAMLALSSLLAVQARVEHLLPTPKSIVRGAGAGFATGVPVRFVGDSAWLANPVVGEFLDMAALTVGSRSPQAIAIEMVDSVAGTTDHHVDGYADESYRLSVTPTTVTVTAATPVGVIRAFQTLAQLAEDEDGRAAEIETVEICDYPSFKVRGYMHDVGRSYIDLDELKREIALLSRFKVNTFHWHFTENQAWRFEVQAFPALTAAASMTRFPGQYYTQAQCRELEEYARQRGVTIIPEIDMPGHSAAFERAMGFAMQSDQGVEALKTILDETAATFEHAPYIHIGADETRVTYPDFIETMTDHVHALGKKVLVWNPASNVAIAKDKGIDMTQMWSTRGKAIAGMPNIDCRYNYSNHFDIFADVVGIFKSNIYYTPEGTDEVAGTIVGIWNDRKTPTQDDIVAQNNLYASVAAIAERAWKGGGLQYIEQGGTMLPDSGDEYDEFSDWERRLLFHKRHSLADVAVPYVQQSNVRWRITEAFPNHGDATAVFPPETSAAPLLPHEYEYGDSVYGSGTATGAAIYLRHTWGKIVPAYYANPQIDHTAYAWTYIYSPREQEAGALIEFQNYSRSEHDMAPDPGQWDRKGSRIWLNDDELLPPAWQNAGVEIDQTPKNREVELLNENFSARAPLPITLKQGWNRVLIKLPYVAAPGVRLNKWMFTFVVTDPQGNAALDGIIYSPDQQLTPDQTPQ